ncbi:DNA polymerase IV [Candidatus Uhrbacteria bacterium CG10_big_fil_rev_8_21_14_0_10_48_11]|uniref:DNA polymerase IV n=1 Tax=Candidatus Uhrbacteria bacterium CG10_big_fil_rev_8_21_14_0_10_48_11 TaxID=1975037 RepID=A0A2M8LFE2_9BACT|nr:MAG: DNA polymerase IV [Candidatus Uhrbacteria bacterium CG10_big_fil_rev_8_21_14_0_10_48_11]
MTNWNTPQWPRAIIHIDGDAFFASCEQALHPEYRGKPVITGKERGIVAAASYEAKAFGITRGVPLWEVKNRCPEAIIVPSDYESYSLFSKRMFAIMRRFTSAVEEYSIDEAFADLTGLARPLGMGYVEIARMMQKTITQELGISVSVGIATTKVLAKLGSKYRKPNGLTAMPNDERREYLEATPVEKIWGIGPKTAAYCSKLGIKTALAFANQSSALVAQRFIKPHVALWQELNGQSVLTIETEEKTTYQSIGKTKTFSPVSSDPIFLHAQLLKNIENACIKARRHRLVASRLIVYLKTQDFRTRAIEGVLSRASAYPQDLLRVADQLFRETYEPQTMYRATGVVLTHLGPDTRVQTSLFEPPIRLEKLEQVYAAVDLLAEKFGKHTVHLLGSNVAHRAPQHARERAELPLRKQYRLKGESTRKHLSIPVLAQTLR